MKFTLFVFASMLSIGGLTVQAAGLPEGPHLVTSGVAQVDAVPDMATLSIEVDVSAKDAASAKKQADDRVVQYINFLTQNAVAKKDMSAANLRTEPEYDYQKDGKSTLKGYRAVRRVDVTVRQLSKLNALLDGALKAGLNDIRAVSPGVANPGRYKDEARQAAIDDAIHQAQMLAKGFHASLGQVYSIRYHVSDYQPTPTIRMMKANAAGATPQETYEQQAISFDDRVEVVFELTPSRSASTE